MEYEYRIINDGELYHYGVKGMKWGIRKVRKWATSEYQPSSTKSSVLSGLYAASGGKLFRKTLDKSNERDAENWKRAKEEYTDRSVRKLNRVNTRMEKHRTVQSHSSKRIAAGKSSKNPFTKMYGASFGPDQKFASARYAKAKKKVDNILSDLDKQGVTLKTLKERKTGLSAGGAYSFVSKWEGVRYELDR